MDRPLSPLDDARLKLERLLQWLRQSTPRQPAADIPTADLDLSRFEVIGGQSVPRAVITLRSSGCAWTRNHGGCTMCGHWAGASLESSPDSAQLIEQFREQFQQVSWSDFPILCLYNGGSVLNPEEVPERAFSSIVDMIAAEPGIEVVALESRAEYIDDARVAALAQKLAPRRLRIAMGLETANDDVRRLSVHKGSSLVRFKAACETIRTHGDLRLYVLIKPPWLTEHEMIDDAVQAIRLAEALGASDIHFEPVTIQRHTLVNLMWRRDLYRLPWLWSVIEVLKRVAPTPVYVSPFAHYPRPIAVPHNCGDCDPHVLAAIFETYNRTYDAHVFDALDCACRARWRDDLALRDPRPLAERVLCDLSEIEAELADERNNRPRERKNGAGAICRGRLR